MIVAIAGATGTLGSLLVPRLLARGIEVRVLTRERERALRLGAVDIRVGDVRDRAATSTFARGADLVVSAVHGFADGSLARVDRDGNANLIAAAKDAGADVVLMSGVGASATASLELMRRKYEAEVCLRESGVRWTIVRASTFLETWVHLLASTATARRGPLVFGRGANPINFVSARDVAALVEHVITDPSTRGEILELGGTADFTLRELADAVAAARHTPPPRHIPRAALRVVSVLAAPVHPRFARQCRAAVTLDRMDARFHGASVRDRFPGLPETRLAELLDSR